jgi:hypothetical protein
MEIIDFRFSSSFLEFYLVSAYNVHKILFMYAIYVHSIRYAQIQLHL